MKLKNRNFTLFSLIRSVFELLVINIQEFIPPSFFKLVIDKFSDDVAMVYISKAISNSFSTSFVKNVYQIICTNGILELNPDVEPETKKFAAQYLCYLMYLATATGNQPIYSTAIISIAIDTQFIKTFFDIVTKSLHQGRRPAEHLDQIDTIYDVEMAAVTLFLEVFEKYLSISELSWERTFKIMDQGSLLRFIVFLKNVLLGAFFQSQQQDIRNPFLEIALSIGSDVLNTLNEINDEHQIINKKHFQAREDQIFNLQTFLQLIGEMNEIEINHQLKVLKKLPICFPFETKYYLFLRILNNLRGHHLAEMVNIDSNRKLSFV